MPGKERKGNDNTMRRVICDKLIINIAVGEAGDRLTKAVRVLNQLSDQTRGEKAMDLIERGLKITDYEISQRHFSETGNFGFGVNEHIDLGLKYDPNTGIYGMDFYIVLCRAGFRVSRKKRKRGRVGLNHKITKAEAIEWVRTKFQAEILK